MVAVNIPVIFTDTSTGNVSISWIFGDGTPQVTGSPVSHAFSVAGTYRVTATITSPTGETESCFQDIVVTPSTSPFVTTIEFSEDYPTVFPGDYARVPTVCKDQYNAVMTCPVLSWVSSAPTIATVDQTGLVHAIAVGTVTITAYNGDVEGHKTITIYASPVTTGVLDVSSTPLGAEIFINNQDQGKVTRSIIQNIPVGNYSLKLTFPGYQDYTTAFTITRARTTTLNPTLTPVTSPISCSISGCPPSIIQGQTMYIQPSFSGGLAPYLVQPLRDGVPYGNPISAPNTNIGQIVIPTDSSWTVGDHLVSFKITDSSSPQASCTTAACTISVTSSAHFVTTIEFSEDYPTVFPGDYARVPTVCKDQYNTVMTCPVLSWQSSDTNIATVDQTGLVHAIAVGTATITAYGGGNVEGHKTITIYASPVTTGVLDVSSTPLGAEIFINNQDQGKVTRSIIQKIPVGNNSLKLTLPGYQDYTTTFIITGAWKTILRPTLTK